MLAAEHYQDLFANFALPRRELLEIHRSKISLHFAKAAYRYPTIRLPYTLSKLAGLPTHIYQTVHDGALAFLVVVSPRSDMGETSADRRAYLHGENRRFEFGRAHHFFSQSGPRIKAEADHNNDDELCNFLNTP